MDALARSVGLYPYVDPSVFDLRDSIAYEYHKPEKMAAEFVFHREQAEIYRRLMAGDNLILSAPTSFGKSKIVDAAIASGNYKNIAVTDTDKYLSGQEDTFENRTGQGGLNRSLYGSQGHNDPNTDKIYRKLAELDKEMNPKLRGK